MIGLSNLAEICPSQSIFGSHVGSSYVCIYDDSMVYFLSRRYMLVTYDHQRFEVSYVRYAYASYVHLRDVRDDLYLLCLLHVRNIPYVRELLRSMPTRKVSVMRRGLRRPPKYVGVGEKIQPAYIYI